MMKNEMKDLKTIANKFFAAYDAHDVEGMLALCADDAVGRYAPYGRNSVVPIRGGLDAIWRAFPQAVPDFRVETVEMLVAEGNTVVVQTIMSGPVPAEAPGIAKKGQIVFIPHAYILRYNSDGKISRARLLLGQHGHKQYQGKRFVISIEREYRHEPHLMPRTNKEAGDRILRMRLSNRFN